MYKNVIKMNARVSIDGNSTVRIDLMYCQKNPLYTLESAESIC